MPDTGQEQRGTKLPRVPGLHETHGKRNVNNVLHPVNSNSVDMDIVMKKRKGGEMDKQQLYREYVLKYGLGNFLLDLVTALDQLQEKICNYINVHNYADVPANYNDKLKAALAQAATYIEMMMEITPKSEKQIITDKKDKLLNKFEEYRTSNE